ncbi:hypothetical protein M3I53_28715 [Paraburkholderia sp. CNPSo 3272]|uniref:hypothetical protein n=1 Tax=Paraburkholderia sp. CNPSo 3272 TaxID=2940931 RepID=UPI0020B8ED4C|nr:hypothetical protein [Paraburkholderia sp. CNPSo 3272]MCP3727067.1 hypothetical protein [Paraburkholderia sp. CNPSo 3272]
MLRSQHATSAQIQCRGGGANAQASSTSGGVQSTNPKVHRIAALQRVWLIPSLDFKPFQKNLFSEYKLTFKNVEAIGAKMLN